MCHFSFHLDLAWVECLVCGLNKAQFCTNIGGVVAVFLDGYHIYLMVINGLKELGTLV